MKYAKNIFLFILTIAIGHGCTTTPPPPELKAPVAKLVAKADTLHGDIRVDNYYWLRDRSNPEVKKYLEDENAYTAAKMKHTEALQETLYNEMVRRIKETDEDPPYRDGNYFYYSRTEKGKQYPIYCRKKEKLDAPEVIYFDQNEMAKGIKFYRLWQSSVSTDGNMLAYSIDTSGAENYILHVKNLASGAIMSDEVQNTQNFTWAADNKTIFYTMEDSAKRPYRVLRHTVGTPSSSDKLIYQENDGLFTVNVDRTRDDQFILLSSGSFNSSEWRYVSASKPNAEFKIVAKRRPEHEYDVDHWGMSFFIRTNSNAKTFRVVRTPVGSAGESKWTDVVPFRDGITVEGLDLFANHMVVYLRVRGLQKMLVMNMKTNATDQIEFPDPVYTAFGNVNKVFATNVFRYSYQSMTRPSSIFDYNLDSKEQKLIKQQEVMGGYDPSEYESKRVYAKADDSTDVPISLVYKKGVKFDGSAPLHLYGYGAYGSSTQPTFSSARLSLLNRGVIYALAHVRGGGDMGREWYDNGKLLKKRNTFTDFIACAEYLLKNNYTKKELLTISGGSAGGLLMGAVTTMRPDLFKAVIAAVPFVDAINTMLDPTLMYTEQEYLEWGNPHEKIAYDYMKTYDPYTNVKATAYPDILVRVGFNDPRVNYWEGTKWVAKLRAMKTDTNTILLKVNMGQGHMGSTGRYDRLKETALDYSYILTQSGIAQ